MTFYNQHMARIYSMMGYKNNLIRDTVPANEFSKGDNIIVLTKNGEPVMSGVVEDTIAYDSYIEIKVGNKLYSATEYFFKRF